MYFQVKLGPKSIKNRRKIDPKSSKFFGQVLGSIFDEFLKDFGPVLGAKMHQNRWKKVLENYDTTMTTKMAKKLNIRAYDALRPDDFGARGGGRRRINHSSRLVLL